MPAMTLAASIGNIDNIIENFLIRSIQSGIVTYRVVAEKKYQYNAFI